MVTRVRAASYIRLQGGTAPKILFTDRGNGFYVSGTGRITPGYDAALKTHNLRAYFGNDASIQPGQLQEVMLHETAVSWTRPADKDAAEEQLGGDGGRLPRAP